MKNKILYIDMDNVLVDFPTGIARIAPELRAEYEGHLNDVPGIFFTDGSSGECNRVVRKVIHYFRDIHFVYCPMG